MKVNIYKISKAHKMGSVIANYDWEKVSEELFFELLTNKIKEFTSDQPDRFEETLNTAKEVLSSPNTLTIGDRSFKCSTKYTKEK